MENNSYNIVPVNRVVEETSTIYNERQIQPPTGADRQAVSFEGANATGEVVQVLPHSTNDLVQYWVFTNAGFAIDNDVFIIIPSNTNDYARIETRENNTFTYDPNHTYLARFVAYIELQEDHPTTGSLMINNGLMYGVNLTTTPTTFTMEYVRGAGTEALSFNSTTQNMRYCLSKIQIFDLTAMATGNTTLDEIVKNTAVNSLKYYSNNDAILIPTTLSSYYLSGTNLWDEQWQAGYWRGDNGTFYSTFSGNISSVNMIPVQPETTYKFIRGFGPTSYYIAYYNKNREFLSRSSLSSQITFTTLEDAYFIHFSTSQGYNSSSAIYNYDICITSDTTVLSYVPYQGQHVEFNSPIELRGIVTNDNPLTFDGDIYTPTQGLIKRKYATLDMGSVNWIQSTDTSRYTHCTTTAINGIKFETSKILSDKYIQSAPDSSADNYMYINRSGVLAIKDTSVVSLTGSEFKNYINGYTLVYELADPISEPALQFDIIQPIDSKSVEAVYSNIPIQQNTTYYTSAPYIDFRYGNNYASDFHLYRVSDGSRYNDNLIPSLTEKTADVPGSDGTYYFNTFYKTRQFTINFAYDSMTAADLRNIRTWFSGKAIRPLVFEEHPEKQYFAKVTGTPSFKYIEFDEPNEPTQSSNVMETPMTYSTGSHLVFKGEGTVQFTCYEPYALSTSQFTNNSIVEGDIATPFVLTTSAAVASNTTISITSEGATVFSITIPNASNGPVTWDSRTGMVKDSTGAIQFTGNSMGLLEVDKSYTSTAGTLIYNNRYL